MPDIKIELYATRDILNGLSEKHSKNFDLIEALDNPTFLNRPRFDAMRRCRLKRAIFIDSDTYFVRPVYQLFDVLDYYEMAACVDLQHIHGLFKKKGIDKILPPISDAVSELNGGVLVVKNCSKTTEFIDRWFELFRLCVENDYIMDQASLRVAVAESGIRVAPLPANYNFRAKRPQVISGAVNILHAHGDLKRIARKINDNNRRRLYEPDPNLIYGFKPKGFEASKHKFQIANYGKSAYK